MPTDYLTPAIEAVRDLVVDLLVNKKWCDARNAGNALEKLVSLENLKALGAQSNGLVSGTGCGWSKICL